MLYASQIPNISSIKKKYDSHSVFLTAYETVVYSEYLYMMNQKNKGSNDKL